MAKVINFEYNNASYNVNYDIVWSFKFCLLGNSLDKQGGVTTFLRTPGVELSGGGAFGALGYLPSLSSNYEINLTAENDIELFTENNVEIVVNETGFVGGADGLNGGLLAIGFDTSGYFALSTTYYDGLTTLIPNSLTIRGGAPSYNLLYSIPLTSLSTEFTLLTTTVNYCWLRFRLGDVGSRIYIDYRYGDGAQYTSLTSLPVSLSITDSTKVNVGISYATPLTSTSLVDTTFLLKSFTIEGNTITTATSTTYTNLTSVGETILIAQSGGNIATEDEHIVLT